MPDVQLPWGAWHAETWHRLPLPEDWSVETLQPQSRAALSAEQIAQAVRTPVAGERLSELAAGCRSACIAVDDLARPTRAADILPAVLEELQAGGVSEQSVRIVVATGSHGKLSAEQMRHKVGVQIAERCQVECHDCRENLVGTGIPYGDAELKINRTFFESELKVAVGSVLPHSFAGYSGGAKLVLPGLADLRATARSHKFVQLGLRGGGDPNENRFRLEAEELSRRIGLRFVVCVVVNSRGETAGLFSGDVTAAHRRACADARTLYRTAIGKVPYDCLILGAFPKDLDLVQAGSALVALKTASQPVVRDEGVIVLATAASEGLGRHGLFEPGGAAYRPPRRNRALGNRELWLYVPSVPTEDVRKIYWDGCRVFHDATHLREALAERFPGGARAAVLPCAPMQQVDTCSQQTAESRL